MPDVKLSPAQIERAVGQAKGMLIAFDAIAANCHSLSADDRDIISMLQAQTMEILEALDGETSA